MKTHFENRAGFTLIEVVAALVLTGIVLAFTAMLLVTSTKIFISSKDAAEDSQKIQVAMNRLVKELTFASAGTVVVTDGRTIQWTSSHPDRVGEAETATWDGTSGSNLTLQGAALLDNVSLFTVSSTADTITITLRSTRSEGVSNTTIIHPRYDQ
ncbi:MAG: prepilin-type N-terminal cleavage/methylation domain-containing protein [Akkermansiaceae bacterium]|jgi:prepilin-type N-terminal cleavage/methylation domain-containing protein